MTPFGTRMQQLLARRGLSYRELARRTHYSKSFLHDLAHGRKQPTADTAARLDEALRADGSLVALANPATEDEGDAFELARRVNASDASDETLTRLESAMDDLATQYATIPPGQLIGVAREHLGYAGRLLDARLTLAHHRRLLVVGGWLSLIAATLHIDLRQSGAALALLKTADAMARHAEHPEIRAWCLETQAWEVLTAGDYMRAVHLSRQAQALAPRGSSALIQANAQEGRAWARMRDIRQTRHCLDVVAHMVSSLPTPDRPEHHYRYDPDKALAYTATTLAWAGDPAAQTYTRAVIEQLENGVIARPRRVASARLDLGLALVNSGDLDEAAAVATQAIASGRVVKSNWWRATEIVDAVETAGLGAASDLREAYEANWP